MKKVFSLLILCGLLLLAITHESEAAGICQVIDSRFEPYTLHHLNSSNLWQLVDSESPIVNVLITTKDCLENLPSFKLAIFSYGYDATEKTITPKVTLLKSSITQVTVVKDGVIKVPLRIGNKNCSGYAIKNGIDAATDFIIDYIPPLALFNYFKDIKFSKKENESCKYFAGFLDQTDPKDRGDTEGILIRDSESKDYTITGLKNSSGFGAFLNKHGIQFECTPTTCNKNETKNADESSRGLVLNAVKAINNGYSLDPCVSDKEDKCYSLLSRFPIPITGGDVFKGEKNDGLDFNGDGSPDLFTFKTTVNTVGDNIPIEHSIILGRTGFSWLFKFLYDMIVYLMIIAAVVRLVYLGYLLITSESAKTKTDIKESFWCVFIGLMILFSVYTILNFVNPDLLYLEPKFEKVFLESAGTDGIGTTFTGTAQSNNDTKWVSENGKVIELISKSKGVIKVKPCFDSDIVSMKLFGLPFKVHKSIEPSLKRINSAWEIKGGNSFYKIPASKGSAESMGGYVCRTAKNSNKLSWHAYGLAIDINPDENPYQSDLKTDMPPAFVKLFTDEGFGWGGAWKSKKDAMHFSKLNNEQGDMKVD